MEVMVEITLPHGKGRLRADVKLDECIFAESFAPLPRDREIRSAVDAQEKVDHQQAMRRHIAHSFGQQLVAKILELIEREDPQHGYSPEEWRQINPARACDKEAQP